MDEWDEMDRRYGRKVDYWTPDENRRTAYLDADLGDGRYSGTEKHSDEPVTVYWTGERYVEIRVKSESS